MKTARNLAWRSLTVRNSQDLVGGLASTAVVAGVAELLSGSQCRSMTKAEAGGQCYARNLFILRNKPPLTYQNPASSYTVNGDRLHNCRVSEERETYFLYFSSRARFCPSQPPNLMMALWRLHRRLNRFPYPAVSEGCRSHSMMPGNRGLSLFMESLQKEIKTLDN